MKRTGFKYPALITLLSLTVFAGAVQAEMDIMGGKATISGGVDVGVQQRNVDGSVEKFEEYRDVQNGFLLHDLRLKLDSNTAIPYYLDIKVKNPVQDNEFYKLNGGIHGKFSIGLFYDSIPHNFSRGTLLHSGVGTGSLLIPDTIQGNLEALEQTRAERGGNPLVDTTGEDAVQQAIVRDLFANRDDLVFKLKREKTGFSLSYNITPDVKTWARVTHEKKLGTRVITAGTYERFAQGASGLTHLSDLFLVTGAELAEPINYRTTVLDVGIGVYKKKWLADITYNFTNFDNNNLALTWDNPFRITDATATNAGGAALVAGDNGFNRGRFGSGLLSMTPDSQSHDFTVNGSVELPMHTRFSAAVTYGLVTQDDAFVPYTLNSALNNLAFAGAPAALGIDVTNPADLPARNLDGDVRTLAMSYQLTSKPVKPLTVTAKYRYYDYDNKSKQILFPGYPGFGESYWRTFKNDVGGTANDGLVINEPLSYTRQNAEVILDYHVIKPLTLSLDGGWELWDRENLRIDDTQELSIGGGFIFKPIKMASLKGSYKFAHRSVAGYVPGNTPAEADGTGSNPEALGLVNYDWADRKRHKADLRLQVVPIQSITLGVSGQYLSDEYGRDNRFGLKKAEVIVGALDAAFSPTERMTFYANYTKEYRKSRIQNGAKDDPFDVAGSTLDDAFATDNFNPFNYWNSNIHDKTDTVGIGATVQLIPDKLVLDTSYNLSFSKTEFNNFNPNAAAANAAGFADGAKLANAVAQDWPTVRDRLHEVRMNLAYSFTKNLKAGITYLYEWYKLDDFAWENMQSYMASVSAENSTKFVFTNSTFKGYEAHVGGVYLSYRF
jgi:MtrB/PioB family decaheme-associated outer membrane protein